MSKSRLRPLITVKNSKPAENESSDHDESQVSHRSTGVTVFKRNTAAFSRWLHIYLSMVSFAILFFFAVTGLTLNHLEWFGDEQQALQTTGNMDVKWVNNPDTSRIAKLQVVEFLRNTHGIKGALSDFRIDDIECTVSFKGPGYSADVFINRETGKYDLSELRMGFIAVVNDLHKGRDTGESWSLIIDISAILMVIVSLTGLIMIFFIKRKRFNGLVLAVAGALITYAIYHFLVK